MFVLNMKVKPKKRTIIAFALVSGLVAVICVACMVSSQSTPNQTATCDRLGTYSLKAENADEQKKFLQQFGIEVEPDSSETEEVVIPDYFNEVYEEYNDLQKQIGLDLEKQKGKIAEKITYKLANSDEYAVLLVVNGTVAGGHKTNGEFGSGYEVL